LSGSPAVELEVGQRTVRITNPERVYFPARGETKADLVRFTLATVPERFARLGDVHAGIDDAVFSLEPLLDWADEIGPTRIGPTRTRTRPVRQVLVRTSARVNRMGRSNWS
jgi:hypothetical protein